MRKGRSIAGPADSAPVNRALSHPNTATIRTPCSSGGLAATGCCQDRGRQGRVTPATPEVTFSDLIIPTRSPGWPQTAAPNRTICPAQTHSPALGRRPNLPNRGRSVLVSFCTVLNATGCCGDRRFSLVAAAAVIPADYLRMCAAWIVRSSDTQIICSGASISGGSVRRLTV